MLWKIFSIVLIYKDILKTFMGVLKNSIVL